MMFAQILMAAALSVFVAAEEGEGTPAPVVKEPEIENPRRLASDAYAREQAAKDGIAEYEFEVAYQNINSVGNSRKMYTVNGLYPGPTIRMRQGQRVQITVWNRVMSLGVAFHWHGLAHRGEDIWYDGSANVAQCPITFSQKFVYDFTVAETQPVGTYMWHAHQGYLRDMGLSGAMIIEPKLEDKLWNGGYPPYCKDLTNVDGNEEDEQECIEDDIVLNIQDYNFDDVTSPHEWAANPETSSPSEKYLRNDMHSGPKTVLVNGRGKASEELCAIIMEQVKPGARSSEADEIHDPSPYCDGNYAPHPYTLEVEQGKTYLIRMMHTGRQLPVDMDFLDHKARFIGNGVSRVQEENHAHMELFRINPGERMEFLLKADQEPGVYVIPIYRFAPFLVVREVFGTWYIKYKSVSLLEEDKFVYKNETSADSSRDSSSIWFDMAIDPAKMRMNTETARPPKYDEVDREILLKISTTTRPLDMSRYPIKPMDNQNYNATAEDLTCPHPTEVITINGVSGLGVERRYEGTPLQILAMQGKLDPEDPHFYYVEKGETVEVVFQMQNICGGASGHSMHMHGYNFWVVAHGHGEFDRSKLIEYEDEKYANGESYGYLSDIIGAYSDQNVPRPVLRAPRAHQGWAVIRYQAVQPGVWPVHCHQSTHGVELGLRTFLVHSPDQIPPPPKGFPMCGSASMAKDEEIDRLKAELAELQQAKAELQQTYQELSDTCVPVVKLCLDDNNIVFGKKAKGKTTAVEAVDLCDCEAKCNEINAWAVAFKLEGDELKKCDCYTKVPKKIKLKKSNGMAFIQLN